LLSHLSEIPRHGWRSHVVVVEDDLVTGRQLEQSLATNGYQVDLESTAMRGSAADSHQNMPS
jgi:DNA-binding response OmpR family regulator